MQNLIGEFGLDLATARMESYLREAERVSQVKAVLRDRSALAAERRHMKLARLLPFIRLAVRPPRQELKCEPDLACAHDQPVADPQNAA